MSAPVLTFFNNKGGVGKTSLIYHLAWMYASMQKRVVVADLDPQSNLTAAFLSEDEIEGLWTQRKSGTTIYQCVKPLAEVADIEEPSLKKISSDLYLIPGDIELSSFEDTLSGEWPSSMGDNSLYRPMRILSSFWQVMQMAAAKVEADIILVDIGPNLGAINRSVLIATNYVVTPLGADLFSLQGLKNLGPTLQSWRKLWQKRLVNWNESRESSAQPEFLLPQGEMRPIGYVCQQHSVRLDRTVKAYDRWAKQIPTTYRKAFLNATATSIVEPDQDALCLSTIKHYRSLVPMGQEHRKPIFNLSSADGAIGSHAAAVQAAKKDFKVLAEKISEAIEQSQNAQQV